MNKLPWFLPVNTAKLTACLALTGLSAMCQPAAAKVFSQHNLVTDNQLVNTADLTDPNLSNAWGISHSQSSPFWVSDNGSGLSTVYKVNPLNDSVTIQPLVVTIPGDGSVTGQVSNGGASAGQFNGDNFLFVSEDGTVSGWKGALGTTAETLVAGSTNNIYKGSAFATIGGNSYLYAANFQTENIDVVKGSGAAPNLTGAFKDPNIPAGFAPFDVQKLGDSLYVTYAKKNGKDDVAGAGNGFVSKFDLQGNFIKRIASQGTLNSPWGLAIAPTTFADFANALLVGNFGDGHINAFDLNTDAFLGQLEGVGGNPLVIDGLWGLSVGNNGNAGSSDKLYFSAGPNGEANGLFGVLQAVPEPGTLPLLGAALLPYVIIRKRVSGKNAPKTKT